MTHKRLIHSQTKQPTYNPDQKNKKIRYSEEVHGEFSKMVAEYIVLRLRGLDLVEINYYLC